MTESSKTQAHKWVLFTGFETQALPASDSAASRSVSQAQTMNAPAAVPSLLFISDPEQQMRCRKQPDFQLLWPTCLNGVVPQVAAQSLCWIRKGGGLVAPWLGWGEGGKQDHFFQQLCWCLLTSTHLCNYSITLLTKSTRFTKTLPVLKSCTMSTSPIQDTYC